MVIVELAAGAIKIAVMVEEVQTADEVLFAASHKFDDPLRADEAVLRDVAEDFEVALSDLECSGSIGIALEARKPRLRYVSHTEIVSRIKPLQVVERLLDSRCHRLFGAVS